MSRRRLRRKDAKARRQAPPPAEYETRVVVREARRVERLAYTRTQAAQALGIGRSTFLRRVLPYVETVEMPWGAKLIPVDELERLLRERRRKVAAEARPRSRPGRKTNVPVEIDAFIRVQRANGKSLAEIAKHLSATDVPTPQGGRQWWPSTIRAVLARSRPLASAMTPVRDAVRGGDVGRDGPPPKAGAGEGRA